MGVAGVLHDGRHIGEVQVDQAGQLDQIGNALHALAQHIVCHGECVQQRNLLLAHELQALVRDDDEGIHVLAQRGNTALCLLHAALALKLERLRDNADGQDAHVAGNFRHNRRSTGAGAAAHACGDENHVAAANGRGNRLAALLAGLLAHLRLGACALAVRYFLADLDFLRRLRARQSLLIGVHRDKLHALRTHGDHAVDRVSAAAADTDHLYDNASVIKVVVDLKRHCRVPLI